jgi:hypothetical protein
MLQMMRTVDRALGYAFVADPSTTTTALSPPDAPRAERDNRHALFSTTGGLFPDALNVQDVQERWVDAREAYDQWELAEWQKEGIRAAAERRRMEQDQKDAPASRS